MEKYFAMGLKPKRKRGPKRSAGEGKTTKGRWRRWCHEKGCNYLECYLPHHLQNRHRTNPKSSVNKLSLKVAKKYQGLEEIKPKDVEEVETDPEEDIQSLPLDGASQEDNTTPKSLTSDAIPPTLEVINTRPARKEEESDQSEDSNNEYPNPTQEAYFTEKQPMSNCHKWLVGTSSPQQWVFIERETGCSTPRKSRP